MSACGPRPAGSDTSGASSGTDAVTGELSSGGVPTGGGGTSTTADLTTSVATTESDETTFDPNGCGPTVHSYPFDADALVTCRLVFDPGAAYRDYVEIEVGGVDVGKPWETDCAGSDGWHYLDPDGAGPDAFELCGSVCADYQTSGELRYTFSCPNT